MSVDLRSVALARPCKRRGHHQNPNRDSGKVRNLVPGLRMMVLGVDHLTIEGGVGDFKEISCEQTCTKKKDMHITIAENFPTRCIRKS